jgi:hypothetical protein
VPADGGTVRVGWSRKSAIASAVCFAGALAVISAVGLAVTREGAKAWRAVLHGARVEVQNSVPLTALGAWSNARTEPPEAVRRFDGLGVRLVGVARPEPALGGVFLVREALAASSEIIPPFAGTVWIPVAPGDAHVLEGLRGRVVRAVGTLRVGMRMVAPDRPAGYTLELGTVWARGTDGTGAGDARHDHNHDHDGDTHEQ